ncbi:hypothetical protein T265_02390 [Opisthorchis viverrini]|uniref:Uncharacterized protein n=1 Tax=Opisthorchis viverrini TaxID=6198 RepID=A0A074ZW39_OPIVI|nr:hypothetical protein T265_02390 [Opisthorchis viverrini]KER31336.1 hypothetical protein T265_02390 [Opisthorchis viverrini]
MGKTNRLNRGGSIAATDGVEFNLLAVASNEGREIALHQGSPNHNLGIGDLLPRRQSPPSQWVLEYETEDRVVDPEHLPLIER